MATLKEIKEQLKITPEELEYITKQVEEYRKNTEIKKVKGK